MNRKSISFGAFSIRDLSLPRDDNTTQFMLINDLRTSVTLSSSRSGFTLIEMMIVIAIIAILATLAAAPYNYFSDKQRVRTQVARFEQLVSQAKSEASNGFLIGTSGNEETANIAIEINPNGGTSVPVIKYIRYRPSDTTVDAYKCSTVGLNDCTKTTIALVDQRMIIKKINGSDVDGTTPIGYIRFDAPNGSGSQTFNPISGHEKDDVAFLLQLGSDPTLTKTVTLSPR